ncbi:MAG: hypothetical protein AB9919_06695 [Geobacteraceae bacterium]
MYQPSAADISNAYYGPRPIDPEGTIKNYMEQALFDPYSAHFGSLKYIGKTYTADITGKHFGYFYCCNINAKNRMGGYTGAKTHLFVLQGDKITHTEEVRPYTEWWRECQ